MRLDGPSDRAGDRTASRPTAVNLRWAVDRQLAALEGCRPGELASRALSVAMAIADEDVADVRPSDAMGWACCATSTTEAAGR